MDDRLRPFAAAIGRLLCLLGVHSYRVIEVSFGFGRGDQVEKVECNRCGVVRTRSAR